MRIVFTLPIIGMAGGFKVIFEYSNRLREKGHEVSVVYPLIPAYKKPLVKIFGAARNIYRGNTVDWFNLKADLIRVPTLSSKHVPDADIVVASWWETAYYVSKYGPNKGEKFYLSQHYETWGGPKEKVDETYRLGLHNIVISSWLKNILKNLGAPVEALIPNGVNSEEFYPEEVPREDCDIRILMPYRKEKWKGIEDGVKAFEIVKKVHHNTKLVMFGPRPKMGELPSGVEFHVRPTNDELRRIYNSCDIFCFPSRVEGFGLPPMEAMACKIPVVTTNTGAVLDYALPGKTALISQPMDVKSMANNILELLDNESRRKTIAEMGYQHIQQFTWDKATNKLEQIFKKYSNN